jgi:flavin-dependent dehydrogenase
LAIDDVVIVGAGPAGSIAALVLARAGARVRLVDRARFPREKLCGDTLNPGSLALLDGLGLGDDIRARALPVGGMIVTGPRGARVEANYPGGLRGAAIRRGDLDLLLVAAATAAGARLDQEVRTRVPIVDTTGTARVAGVRIASARREEPIAARVVIAADGRASRLASTLGLSRLASTPRRWAFGAYFSGVTGQTTHGEMHVRRDGYVGVAPLPCGLTNVCVVRDLDKWARGPFVADTWSPAGSGRDEERPDAGHYDRVIAEAVAGDEALRGRFAGARQVSAVSVLGPLAVDATAAGCPGLLLAGDAAGFIDPMTGDGLRFAMRGGMLAADAALHELETGRPAYAILAQARAREFAGKWRVNRALRSVVGSPAAVSIAARIAACWDAPVRYLVGVAGDVRFAS